MPFLMSPSAFGGWAPAGSPPSGVLRTFPGPVGDERVSGPSRPLGVLLASGPLIAGGSFRSVREPPSHPHGRRDVGVTAGHRHVLGEPACGQRDSMDSA